jgi:predicted lactoylglutathione lyase
MTQTNPAIRQLAEETAESIFLDGFAPGTTMDVLSRREDPEFDKREIADNARIIESALTALATQIREEDARIVRDAKAACGEPECPACEHLDEIAAAIRARQEK